MSKKGSEKTPKTDCCDQKGCCPSSEESSKQQPPSKKQWWKIAVFSLGMLMVVGAITYSLVTRHTSAATAPIDNSSVQLDNGVIRRISSGTCSEALSGMGVGDLQWAQELNTIYTNHDLVFVILPENDPILNDTLSNRISDATAKIEARGARVGTFTLSDTDPEFSITIQRLAIGQLPAVLAISTSGNGAIITGDITEGQLLQTYVVVSQPVCAPGSSPGCCSGK
jgi:hypothetical protein